MALKVVPWLQPLIDELWKNKSGYLKDSSKYTWDAPDYGGLTKEIWDQLEYHHLDVISVQIDYWYDAARTKAQFTRILIDTLSNGLITV